MLFFPALSSLIFVWTDPGLAPCAPYREV